MLQQDSFAITLTLPHTYVVMVGAKYFQMGHIFMEEFVYH